MLGSTAKAAILLSCTAGALAQQLATCDGFREPDWDDCQVIYDEIKGKVGPVDVLQPYPDCSFVVPVKPGYNSNDYNCGIMICPMAEDTRVLWSDVRTGFDTVKSVCRGTGAGGQDRWNPNFVIQVKSNPDYDTSPVTIGSREAANESATAESIADEKTYRLHQRDFATKRQSPDDDSFTLLVTQQRVQLRGTEQAVSGELTAGSTVTLTQESSTTTGVSVSAEVSAGLFEIFEASISTEVSASQTATSAWGIEVNVDCNSGQQGIIYWYPLFTLYQGRFEPSSDIVDFYIPDDSVAGTTNFDVTCLG